MHEVAFYLALLPIEGMLGLQAGRAAYLGCCFDRRGHPPKGCTSRTGPAHKAPLPPLRDQRRRPARQPDHTCRMGPRVGPYTQPPPLRERTLSFRHHGRYRGQPGATPGQDFLRAYASGARGRKSHSPVKTQSNPVLPVDQQENPSAPWHAGEPAQDGGDHRPTDARTLRSRGDRQVSEPPSRTVLWVRMSNVKPKWFPIALSHDEHMGGSPANGGRDHFERSQKAGGHVGVERDTEQDVSRGTTNSTLLQGSTAPGANHENLREHGQHGTRAPGTLITPAVSRRFGCEPGHGFLSWSNYRPANEQPQAGILNVIGSSSFGL